MANASDESPLRRLRDFVPEGREYMDAVDRALAEWGEDPLDREHAYPLFCETVLYPLLGKEDARTVMALLGQAVRRERGIG